MKDNRKPWMKELQSYRFSRDGLMTQETATEQRNANKRDASANYGMSEATFKENARFWGFVFPYDEATQ